MLKWGQKTWNTFVCLPFIFMAAGEDQRDHTKTFQTGNECPPCTCHAASSTCWSSCLGKTCNLQDEVRIRSHERSPPRIYFHMSETVQRSLPRVASGIVYLSV